MTKAEEYLNKAKEKYAEGEQHKNIAVRCFESCRQYKIEYRIESVNRVLDFIRNEYRDYAGLWNYVLFEFKLKIIRKE